MNKKRILLAVASWFGINILQDLTFYSSMPLFGTTAALIDGIKQLLISGLIFFPGICYINPNYLFSNKRIQFLVSYIVLFFIVYGITYLYEIFIVSYYPLYDGTDPSGSFGTYDRYLIFETLSFYIVYVIPTILYSFFLMWFDQRIKQAELEKEVNIAKLNALKNQINPHFLFNTLNYLYSEVYQLSENAAKATMLLSNMMRYSLNTEEVDGKANLKEEIDHIKNFIEIHRLRYNNKVELLLVESGNIESCRIIPQLLITFVENAFKHGQINNSEYPIKIEVGTKENGFFFTCSNVIRLNEATEKGGIGMKNIKNRLNLAYPGKHSLLIEEGQYDYKIHLNISNG